MNDHVHELEALRREVERLQFVAAEKSGLLDAVLAQSPYGIIISDPHGKLILQNEASQRIWAGSATADTVAEWGQYRAFHEDGRPAAPEEWAMAVCLRERVPMPAQEMHIQRFDGTRGVLLGGSAPIFGPDGALLGAVSVFADITPLKASEALQRREEQRRLFLARAVAELSGSLDYEKTLAAITQLAVPLIADWAAVDLIDDHGAVRRLAVAHVDPAKIAIVREIEQHYPPDPDAPNGVRAVIRSGKPTLVASISDEMLAARTRDAEHLRMARALGLQSYLVVPLNARGRTLGTITLVTAESKVTYGPADLAFAEELAHAAAISIDHARLFAELQESERRYRLLTEVAPQIVWAADAQGALTFINHRMAEYVGESADPSDKWTFAIHPDDRDPVQAAWRHAIDTGTPYEVTLRLRRADGQYRWHLARALPQHEDGRVVGWYATSTDIHDQKQAVDEREKAVRSRDDFLAVVSHDLRNPLSTIVSSAGLLQRGQLDPRAQKAVDAIGRASVRMEHLIRDLLDIASIDAGQLSVVPRSQPVPSLLGELLEAHESLARAKEIGLRLERPAGLQPVLCDRDRVLQVLANLVGNAIKFTPSGGSIIVAAASAGSFIEFSVADDGPGMTVEQRARAFERYWRGSAAGGGVGLGMAIAKGIVEAHGGRIAIDPAYERGTRVAFTLPIVG